MKMTTQYACVLRRRVRHFFQNNTYSKSLLCNFTPAYIRAGVNMKENLAMRYGMYILLVIQAIETRVGSIPEFLRPNF